MDRATLIGTHPRLFHMADGDAWDSIQEHGLESTKALVDRYAPDEATRESVLLGRRDSTISLLAPGLPDVQIRDQKPLRRLNQALAEGTTAQQFLDLLNNRVFFWLTEDRLQRLLNAYVDRPRIVLTLDTEKLLAAHAEKIELSPYNSGSVDRPNPPRRSRSMFTPIADFPYEEWRRKGRSRTDAVVELTVVDKVPDVTQFVLSVDCLVEGEPPVRVYTA